MFDSVIKAVVGDLDEKRAYRQLMKRVKALPEDYRFAFRRMQHYMFSVGPPSGDITVFTDLKMFTDLVELFEASAAEGKPVLDVIGNDAAGFIDEFMRASDPGTETRQARLNREISQQLHRPPSREGKPQ